MRDSDASGMAWVWHGYGYGINALMLYTALLRGGAVKVHQRLTIYQRSKVSP